MDDRPVYYRVRNWDRDFEVPKSRGIKKLSWLGMPVDLLQSRQVRVLCATQDERERIFGIQVAIILTAGQVPLPYRGILYDQDGPVTAFDFATEHGFDEHRVIAAFEILMAPKTALLELVAIDENGTPVVVSSDDWSVRDHTWSGEVWRGLTEEDGDGRGRKGTDQAGQDPAQPRRAPIQDKTDTTNRQPQEQQHHTTRPDPTGTDTTNNTGHGTTEPDPDRPDTDHDSTQGPGGAGRGDLSELAEIQGNGRAATQRFLQLFWYGVCEAAELPEARRVAERDAICAVGRRILRSPQRAAHAQTLIDLARAKTAAGLNNPMAAWMAEVNKRWPKKNPEPRLAATA